MQFGITINSPKWALGLRLLLLALAVLGHSAMALTPAQAVPDFTLPSVSHDYAQRLAEQRGKPVMLLMLKRCDDCTKQLLDLQALANQYANNDLVSWVVWTPHKKDVPPQLNLPVLKNDPQVAGTFVVPHTLPAVYLIDRNGHLRHELNGSYKSLSKQLTPLLEHWLNTEQPAVQE